MRRWRVLLPLLLLLGAAGASAEVPDPLVGRWQVEPETWIEFRRRLGAGLSSVDPDPMTPGQGIAEFRADGTGLMMSPLQEGLTAFLWGEDGDVVTVTTPEGAQRLRFQRVEGSTWAIVAILGSEREPYGVYLAVWRRVE